MNEKEKQAKKDPFDGDYIGNIWGWKNTFFGLAIILFFLGLMVYRHVTMGIPIDEGMSPEKTEQVEKDSI